MTSLPTSSVPVKPGSLTVAGSGIASVAHMTLQAVTALKNAARVYYWVNDPVAEAYILDNNANTVNLAIYVEFGKQMHRTYIEMAEVMLREVRAGHDVLGMFYGHPGFFLAPSHRALTIARQEGYEAKMLPGVSTFDYMLAELEFEPAYYGCTVHDAANILVRGKRLDPSQHHVLINISVHAIPTTESESPNFQRLIDHLIQNLGPEHKAVLYTAGILPQTPSAMQVYALEDFHNPLLASAVHGRSCMYIPPRDIAPLNATSLAALGLQDSDLPLFDSTPHWVGPRFVEAAGYGMAEQVIVAELDQHVIPASHRSLRASPAMKQFMIQPFAK